MDAISADQHLIRDEQSLNALYGEISAGAIAKRHNCSHIISKSLLPSSGSNSNITSPPPWIVATGATAGPVA